METKNVLITTKHRGVFFAKVSTAQLEQYKKNCSENPTAPANLVDLKECRMAIYFGTTKGVMELASTGPTQSSRIGAPADVDIMHDVTAVFSVTDNAAERWNNAK